MAFFAKLSSIFTLPSLYRTITTRRRINNTQTKSINMLHKSTTDITKVSLNITKHLLSKQEFKDKNVVFSPLSLQVVLSIIAAGSEGPTQHQLLSFLGSKSIDHLTSLYSQHVPVVLSDAASVGGPRLSFTNGVWVEQSFPLYPSFKEIVETNYKATLASVDFLNKADEVRKEVNLWAEKETNGLIKDILPPKAVDSLTRLIFGNALYFKGVWDQQFDASKTKENSFHLLNGGSIKVPFMTSKEDQLISVFDGYKILCLPYKQGEDQRQFSMFFVLPDKKDGLLDLVEKVAFEPDFLEDKLPYRSVKVGDFRIPSFKISFELETSNALKELRVVLPFSKGGLTKITDSPIWISSIYQKSFIEVNEKGTEAAAVTLSRIHGCCRNPPTPTYIDFIADHPFLFFIREDLSGIILFVGQVLNHQGTNDLNYTYKIH